MDSKKQRALVAASVAGLLAAVGSGILSQQAQAADEAGKAPCYGINKCNGTGDCGGPGHTCAGQNGCEGQGYVKLEKDLCLRIKGGRLTQEEQPQQ